MTEQVQASQQSTVAPSNISDKELNFRKLEEKYQRQLEAERQARLEAEKLAKEAMARKNHQEDDEEVDDEPYVDHRRLNKKLAKHSMSTKSEIENAMNIAREKAKQELKQEIWLENNPDFYDVIQNNADKLYQADPELANTILEMPQGFAREKLVYKNIKALGLDKPKSKESTIQEKIDSNRRTPYYQPSHVGTAPYASSGDFSAAGQKNAYEKMQELKSRLRLG